MNSLFTVDESALQKAFGMDGSSLNGLSDALALPSSMNLQDTFLNEARKENAPVSIFLMNGVQLKGKVKSFDSFTVLLVSENRSQLIYKHAISTIQRI